MQFTFTHPQYLFFLFALPIIFIIHFLSLSSRKKTALKFANFQAIARIQGIDFFSKNIVILFLNLIIVVLLIFAVSGLTMQTFKEASVFSFVLAIDSSESMGADDFSPTRLNAAKQTAIDFVDLVPFGTRFGVVSFAGSTYMEIDMIEDKSMVRDAINNIQLTDIGGTDLYEAVITSSNLLKPEDHKAIILLSDGQINVGTVDDAIAYANQHDVIVHTIAMGTPEGGLADYGISKLDESSLKSLAYNTGGTYFSAEDQTRLTESFSDVLDVTEKKVSIPLSPYLLIFAIVLFVIAFLLNNTRYVGLP